MSIYMKVDGIEGSVSASGLDGFVALTSFDVGVNRRVNTQPGSVNDRANSKPALSEVTVTKVLDKTSPYIFGEATVGKVIDEVVVKFVSATGDDLVEYLEITLDNVIVSHYELMVSPEAAKSESSADASKPIEKIQLNYDKIEVKFTPYDSSNNPEAPIPVGYDLALAQAC